MRIVLAAAAAVLLAQPATALGQAAPPSAAALARPRLEGVHVAVRGRGTAVAAAVVVPAGSAADPLDAPGTAYLLAQALAAGARQRIAPGARLSVSVERDWTAFVLLAPPDAWAASLDALSSVLFEEPVPVGASEAVRSEILQRFRFEEGAPVREFQRELYGVLTSAANPWARPPRGQPEAVRALGTAALALFRRSHYEPGAARVGVAGPVDALRARAAVAAAGLGGRASAPPRESDDLAWDDGARLLLSRPVTNAWIGVLFPAPADARRTTLEALAYRVNEELNPATPAPGIFAASARIERTPDGPVLVIQAAVSPETAQRWQRRIVEMVDELEDPAGEAFFRWQRRRFRSGRLLQEAAPEEQALRVALDLLVEGRVRDLPAEIWALSAEALAEVADDLGEPRILVLGPDLTDHFR